ncbi:MAG: helix-turn-helix domain-containing protein [Alistipes sp.]|nr:helix-turn-helix domain-containing protein [Alistipes sp.]
MNPREFNEIKGLLVEIRDTLRVLADAAQKELLTPAEVCKLLKIGRTTYQRYVDKGLFEQVRIDKGSNGKVYVKRSKIQELIDEGKI